MYLKRSCSQSKVSGGAIVPMVWCGIDIYPCYHELNSNFYRHIWRGVLDTTFGSRLLVTLGTPVSSTNKTDRHDIATILLLKWAYNDSNNILSPLKGTQTTTSESKWCSIGSAASRVRWSSVIFSLHELLSNVTFEWYISFVHEYWRRSLSDGYIAVQKLWSYRCTLVFP